MKASLATSLLRWERLVRLGVRLWPPSTSRRCCCARPLPLWPCDRADHRPGLAAALCGGTLAVGGACRSIPASTSALRRRSQACLDFQTSTGQFRPLGSGLGDNLWLDAYVGEFPDAGPPNLAIRCPSQAAGARDPESPEHARLHDRSRGKRDRDRLRALTCSHATAAASVGDLRYYADTRLDEFASPMARAPDRRRPFPLR